MSGGRRASRGWRGNSVAEMPREPFSGDDECGDDDDEDGDDDDDEDDDDEDDDDGE